MILIGIANTALWQMFIGFLIYLVTEKDVFENFKELSLNKRFRVFILIQITWGLILWDDSLIHPSIYHFTRKSFSKSYLKDFPFYIWLLSVFFKRLMAIEKKLEEINNKF